MTVSLGSRFPAHVIPESALEQHLSPWEPSINGPGRRHVLFAPGWLSLQLEACPVVISPGSRYDRR